VTGLVNQQALLQNEYVATDNRILRAQLPKRLRLTDPERSTLVDIGKRLGCKALEQVACVVKPDTILGWYRRLIAQKFDGSKYHAYPGRPRIGASSANPDRGNPVSGDSRTSCSARKTFGSY
jgi:putative transposase